VVESTSVTDSAAASAQRVSVYRFSYIYRLVVRLTYLKLARTVVFFWWVDKVFEQSLTGRTLRRFNNTFVALSSGSFFLKKAAFLFRLLLVPSGKLWTGQTLFGIVVAIGCFVPTEAVFALMLAVLFLTLWERAKKIKLKSVKDTDEARKIYSDFWQWPPIQLSFPLFVAFLFVIGAALSSVVPRSSVVALIVWGFYVLSFFMGLDAAFRGNAESVIWPVLTGVTFSSLVGIYQRLSGWQLTRSSWLDERFQGEIVRIVGTFTNPTFFAEMIGLVLPVALALLIKRRAFKDRMLLLIYAIVQGTALILTYSRGAWLGFIASFCLLCVFYEKRLFILGLILAIIGFIFAPPVLLERLLSSFTLNDSSNSYRFFIWRGSLALLEANLFRGVGLGAESFVCTYPEYMIIQTPAPHAHSTYLEMLIELGLFGFVALMWFLCTSGYYMLRTILKQKGNSNFRWTQIGALSGVMSAIGGHLLQGLVEHTWYNPKVTIVFWSWMGIATGIAMLKERFVDGGSRT